MLTDWTLLLIDVADIAICALFIEIFFAYILMVYI